MYITLLVVQFCVIVFLVSVLVHCKRKKRCPQRHSTSKCKLFYLLYKTVQLSKQYTLLNKLSYFIVTSHKTVQLSNVRYSMNCPISLWRHIRQHDLANNVRYSINCPISLWRHIRQYNLTNNVRYSINCPISLWRHIRQYVVPGITKTK